MEFLAVAKKITNRRINTLLSVVLLLQALYILVWPFLPGITWWVRHDVPIVSGLTAPKVDLDVIPEENTILIPSLGLTEKIHEGADISTVHRGVWRRPGSSTPNQGSNTVLVGHRFTYDGVSVFYNLDKVKIGDEIVVYWQREPHRYKVDQIVVVPPEAVEAEEPTVDSVLTLYTCTPLLTAKDRLVVRARPIE
jgi:sortase A